MSPAQDNGYTLTIDELARQSGMTVRNIRAHQSRGLLQPPEVQGRTGYYGNAHVQRLEVIKNLQADGFNLTAIQRLLEQAHATGDELGELRTTVLTPFEDEQTEIVNLRELAVEYGVKNYDELLKRAEKAGFVYPVLDGKHEVVSPTILRAGLQVIQLGLSIREAFDLLLLIEKHTRAVADAFAKMADDTVVRPFEDRGFQQDEWIPVRDAIQALRPIASEVVLAAFKIEMSQAAEDQFGKALSRAASKPVIASDGDGRKRRAQAARDRSQEAAKTVARQAGRQAAKAVPKVPRVGKSSTRRAAAKRK